MAVYAPYSDKDLEECAKRKILQEGRRAGAKSFYMQVT